MILVPLNGQARILHTTHPAPVAVLGNVNYIIPIFINNKISNMNEILNYIIPFFQDELARQLYIELAMDSTNN